MKDIINNIDHIKKASYEDYTSYNYVNYIPGKNLLNKIVAQVQLGNKIIAFSLIELPNLYQCLKSKAVSLQVQKSM